MAVSGDGQEQEMTGMMEDRKGAEALTTVDNPTNPGMMAEAADISVDLLEIIVASNLHGKTTDNEDVTFLEHVILPSGRMISTASAAPWTQCPPKTEPE